MPYAIRSTRPSADTYTSDSCPGLGKTSFTKTIQPSSSFRTSTSRKRAAGSFESFTNAVKAMSPISFSLRWCIGGRQPEVTTATVTTANITIPKLVTPLDATPYGAEVNRNVQFHCVKWHEQKTAPLPSLMSWLCRVIKRAPVLRSRLRDTMESRDYNYGWPSTSIRHKTFISDRASFLLAVPNMWQTCNIFLSSLSEHESRHRF